jgi:IS30 family transposase
MGKQNYTQLTLEERCTVSVLQKEGRSIRQIAAALARSASTISREIKRNETKTLGYKAGYAQQQARGRRWQGSRLERQPTLRTTVLDLLAMGWSPQQVASRLAQEQGCKVISHESIYRFIYAQLKRTKDYTWRHYLPYRKSKRGWRGRKGGSPALFIKERVPINKRPKYISKRASAGHWEADLMLFSKYGQALLVVHERYSRLLFILKLKSKSAKPIAAQLIDLFSFLPKSLTKTVTFDNGTEFSEHHQLKKLGMSTYFCDVRAPWQKGGVENAIGRLRRSLPRKTDIAKLQDKDFQELVGIYNHTPRKCLGYKTPAEVFIKQLLHFKCESTFPPVRE